MNIFAREYARVVPGISYRMFVPSKAVADNMLFQTKTFQRRNIFQWISMNLESFLIALTAITHFRRTHISLFLKLGLQRILFFRNEAKSLNCSTNDDKRWSFYGFPEQMGFVQTIAHKDKYSLPRIFPFENANMNRSFQSDNSFSI